MMPGLLKRGVLLLAIGLAGVAAHAGEWPDAAPTPEEEAAFDAAARPAGALTADGKHRAERSAHALEQLARRRLARDEAEAARHLFTRLLELQSVLYGDDDARVANTLVQLGRCHQALGLGYLAGLFHTRAVAILQAVPRPEVPPLAAALQGLGDVQARQHRVAEADRSYRQALALHEKDTGPATPQVARLLLRLAALYQDHGRLDQAEPLYHRARGLLEAAGPAEHAALKGTLQNMAGLYRDLGQAGRAEELSAQAARLGE